MTVPCAACDRNTRRESLVGGLCPDCRDMARHDERDDLKAEVERLRAVLREIARTATQSGDTAFGGRLCHQIEQMARAALAE